MPNTFFRFKQFTVYQERAAMKVCTDACLFGAWAAKNVDASTILDIGTGTGLLSLMLAQVSDASIHAVEIDEQAYEQASHNFNASPWAARLEAFHIPIQDFQGKVYDFIISNPPFYSNDLKSDNIKRNLALHSDGLRLEELLDSVTRLLASNGLFAILLTFHRAKQFEELVMKYRLFVKEKVQVRQSDRHDFFRVMYLLANIEPPHETRQSEITIGDSHFKELLKEYYL